MAYTTSMLLSLRLCSKLTVLTEPWYPIVKQFGLLKTHTRRGTKAGIRHKRRQQDITVADVKETLTARPIAVITSQRLPITQSVRSLRDACHSNLIQVQCSNLSALNNHEVRHDACKGQGLRTTAQMKRNVNLKTLLLCSLNAQSVNNKASSIAAYITENDLDLLAIQETWIRNDSHLVVAELVQTGYKIISIPQMTGRGGGVALIYKSGLDVTACNNDRYNSFELLQCQIKLKSDHIRLLVMYRPPPSTANQLTVKKFFDEFQSLLDKETVTSGRLLLVGDINLHLDRTDDVNVRKFCQYLSMASLKQHVEGATHKRGHTLDIVVTRETDKLITDTYITDPGLCDQSSNLAGDHYAIHCSLDASKPPQTLKQIQYRKLKAIDVANFNKDLASSQLSRDTHHTSVTDLVTTYNNVLSDLINTHAPLKTKAIILRPNTAWHSPELKVEKHTKRKLERKWRRTRLEIDHQIYRRQCCKMNVMVNQAKRQHYSNKIAEAGTDRKALFGITNGLLHKTGPSSLPPFDDVNELVNRFADYFHEKIMLIRDELTTVSELNSQSTELGNTTLATLSVFEVTTAAEVGKIIASSPSTSCELDPLPTWLVKKCSDTFVPYITDLINLSMQTSEVPAVMKNGIIVKMCRKLAS